ncbi:MAG: carotenoid oxygenase family protein [Acidobacteriota bacterium]
MPQESDGPITQIEGSVPSWLRGTYYLNGPGRFTRGGRRWGHWLDGDGFVTRLRFEGGAGTIHATHRFVASRKRSAEEEAGRPLFRAFGTAFEDDRLMGEDENSKSQHGRRRALGLESPVNVSVYPFAEKLLAFGEQGLPWELDESTLETLGEHDFHRRLPPVAPFAAHPNFDERSGEMVNFGISFSTHRPQLRLYTFGPDGRLLRKRSHALDAPRSVHDFGLSESFCVFHLGPYLLNMEPLTAGASLLEALTWQPELGTKLLILHRNEQGPALELELPTRYCLHFIGCYEPSPNQLVVDCLELEKPIYDQYTVPDLFTDVRHAHAVRYRIDLEQGCIEQRQELDFHHLCDFPATDPRQRDSPPEDLWVLGLSATDAPGRKFFDEISHLSWTAQGLKDRYLSPPGCYLGGEPVFLPELGKPGQGLLICQELDARDGVPASRRSSFLLLDAQDLAAGPIARLRLPSPVPLRFHACFRPDP